MSNNNIQSAPPADPTGIPDVQPPAPRASDGKANILLVDDREDKRLAMETIIAGLGENLVKVSSGKEALRCLLNQDFAVILLDVNMPGMDGFETAFLIRQRRRSEHTPIIFVTGISDTETHVSRGYSLGAVDYILTPVLPDVLRTKVSVFVELFKKTEQLKRQTEWLRMAHDELELRVRERTSELAAVNQALQREIAERQHAEQRVLKVNSELERRVLERTAELAAANQELEAFSYSVAHDLQAPLRHIESYAQLLTTNFASQIPPEAQEYLQRIGLRGQYMRQLVSDLLNLSCVVKQELVRQPVEIRSLVDEVIAGFQSEIQGRQIEWRVGDLPCLACDPALVKQVFANLISNAIKYTRPRARALIEIGQMKVDGQTFIFVRDDGVGFDMKYVSKLFGVFQRLHASKDFDGTGVGLAIVARIVRKHGGEIRAEGEVNKGATFRFTLEQGPGSTGATIPATATHF
jgi:two-component system sensor histidine kinase/response regulator